MVRRKKKVVIYVWYNVCLKKVIGKYITYFIQYIINDLYFLFICIVQTEIENLKQTVCDMEEKVQYQSDERLRDVNEVLENCQTRVSITL